MFTKKSKLIYNSKLYFRFITDIIKLPEG